MPREQGKTVQIPKELHAKAKAQAALTGRPLQDILAELVEEWLKEEERKRAQAAQQPR